MDKKELLEQYPDLIRDIALSLFKKGYFTQSSGVEEDDEVLRDFNQEFNEFVNLQTKKDKSFSNLEKIKQKLFTTEDGVDIYEGDKYFELIIPGFHNKQCVWNILPYEGKSNLIYDQEGNRKHFRLWFSTEKAAEEYIIMNKPCLSLKELNNLKLLNNFAKSRTIRFVKNKLKLNE